MEELGHAVGIHPTEDIGLEELVKDHIEHCGQLLVLKKRRINLIHQSVRDYLLREDIDSNTVLEQFRVKKESAHFEIAQVCLQSLFVGKTRQIKPGKAWTSKEIICDHQHDQKTVADVFHKYASCTWFSHVKNSGSMGLKLLAPFELQLNRYTDNKYCLKTGLSYEYFECSYDMTRLNLFCARGLTSWVREKCTKIKDEVQPRHTKKQTSKEYYEALHTASVFDQEEVVQLLLDLGAEFNRPRRPSTLRTEITSRSAWIRALGTGPDGKLSHVDLLRIQSRSVPVLMRATVLGHTKVVETLLKAGAQTSTTDSSGETTLHWAAYQGHAQLVQMLLDSGAGKIRCIT